MEDDPDQAAKMMVETFARLYQAQAAQRVNAARLLSAYLGRDVAILSPQDIEMLVNDDKLPIIQGIVDTAKAQIASVQRPKPVCLTKGGTYRERQEAKKYTRFAEAQMWQPCGRYPTFWDMGEQLVKDGAIWGDGVCKVIANPRSGAVEISRRFIHDIYVSNMDSLYGSPTTWYETYTFDRYNLCALYPDNEEAIMTASSSWDLGRGRMGEDDDRVQIVEAFRLPSIPGDEGPAGEGRWMIALQSGAKQTWLVNEPWENPTPPYGFFSWEPNSYGVKSTGLVQAVEYLKDDINEILDYIIENTKIGGWGAIEFTEGDFDEDEIRSNGPHRLLKRRAGTDAQSPLILHNPPPFNPAVINAWEVIRSAFFETTGISDMSTQGRVEQGITAGVAIRTVNDLRTQRFLPKSRSYEQLAATVGKLTLQAAAHLKNLGISPKAALFREGYLDEVDFNGIDLALERCEITVQSQSSTEDTKAGRLEAIQEMANAGYITPEQANVMLSSSNPDVEAFTRQTQAQQRYYQKLIAKFQEAEPKTWKPIRDFQMPDPIMNIKMGIRMLTDGYAETKCERDVPAFNLDLFINWIVFAWQTLERGDLSPLTYDEAQQMAVPAATPGGTAEVGAPPGAMPAQQMMDAELAAMSGGAPPPMPPTGAPPGAPLQ